MNNLEKILSDIMYENRNRINEEIVMAAVSEICDNICGSIAEQMNMPYEDVNSLLMMTQAKFRKKLGENKNAD